MATPRRFRRILLGVVFVVSLGGTGLCVANLVQLRRWRLDWEYWRGRGNPQATDAQLTAALADIHQEAGRWTTAAIPLALVMVGSGALLLVRLARRRDYIYVSPRHRVPPSGVGTP